MWGGEHIWDQGKTPPQRDPVSFLLLCLLFSFFHPDQEGKREGALCGVGEGELLTFKSLDNSSEWMEMELDLVDGNVAWRLPVGV